MDSQERIKFAVGEPYILSQHTEQLTDWLAAWQARGNQLQWSETSPDIVWKNYPIPDGRDPSETVVRVVRKVHKPTDEKADLHKQVEELEAQLDNMRRMRQMDALVLADERRKLKEFEISRLRSFRMALDAMPESDVTTMDRGAFEFLVGWAEKGQKYTFNPPTLGQLIKLGMEKKWEVHDSVVYEGDFSKLEGETALAFLEPSAGGQGSA